MLQKITRTFAKKLFEQKEPFWILPSQSLNIGHGIYADYWLQNEYNSFERMENRFKYHCCNDDVGKYPRYFIEL